MSSVDPGTEGVRARAGLRAAGVPKGLLLLNAGLVGALGALLWMGEAGAQGAATRAEGRYVLLSGEASGLSTPVVYVLDTANQEVIALRWDERTDRAEILGFRDLRADAANQNPSR